MRAFNLKIGEKVHFQDGSVSVMLVGFLQRAEGVVINIFRGKTVTHKECKLQWGDEIHIGNNPNDFFRPVKQINAYLAACYICSGITVSTDAERYDKRHFARHHTERQSQANESETKAAPVSPVRRIK